MHRNVPHLLLMIFIAHNDIHGSLAEGYNPGRVRERLRAQIHFSHTSYSLQIPALTRTLNSEVSTPKKQHLMIFMRALLTTIIGQCRVKTLNTELAIACLYKAVMRFMSSQNAPKCATLIVNDIHSP